MKHQHLYVAHSKTAAVIQPKPLLKWAGGKGQLLPELLSLVPDDFDGTYIEPFFGGGALYFALQPKTAIISDKNPEIVNVYQQVANDPEAIIAALKRLTGTSRTTPCIPSESCRRTPPGTPPLCPTLGP